MKRSGAIGAMILACVALAGPAAARNEVFQFPIQEVTNSTDFARVIGPSVKFVFAEPAPATGYVAMGEYIADESEHFHGKSDEATCKLDFFEALQELKEHAQKLGADTVIGIVSFYRRTTFSSTTEFECHGGSTGAFVTLKGTLAKAQ